MAKKQYLSSEDITLSREEIRDADKTIQEDIMRTWFLWHYEDPAQSTPYISSEGGYLYLWGGGPYDANEELMREFEGLIPDTVIQELVDELEHDSPEWAGKSNEYYYSATVLSNTEFYDTFSYSISIVQELFKSPVNWWLQEALNRLLYVSIITSLETFLSDAFIITVINDLEFIKKFVETTPEFAKRKLMLSEIFNRVDNIQDEVKDHLLGYIWHRLPNVMRMYKDTLNVDFPKDQGHIIKAIQVRHDIVHRNGKDKDGEPVSPSNDEVSKLMEDVSHLVDFIAFQLGGENLLPLDEFHKWKVEERLK